MPDKEESKEYAVPIPSLFEAIGLRRGELYFSPKECAIAFHTQDEARTERQKAIVKRVTYARIKAYYFEHAPTPKNVQKIIRIMNDIDDVEDIMSTASFAAFAAGIVVPPAAGVLLPLSATTYTATIPMNMTQAALGLTTGPAGAKRAIESLAELLPNGKLKKAKMSKLVAKMPKFLRARYAKVISRIQDKIIEKTTKLPISQLKKMNAEQLMNYAIAQAKVLGIAKIDLTSHPSRDAANRLYQRLGFELRDTNAYRLVL